MNFGNIGLLEISWAALKMEAARYSETEVPVVRLHGTHICPTKQLSTFLLVHNYSAQCRWRQT